MIKTTVTTVMVCDRCGIEHMVVDGNSVKGPYVNAFELPVWHIRGHMIKYEWDKRHMCCGCAGDLMALIAGFFDRKE